MRRDWRLVTLRALAASAQPLSAVAVAQVVGWSRKHAETRCKKLRESGAIWGRKLPTNKPGEPPMLWALTKAGRDELQGCAGVTVPNLEVGQNQPAQQFSIGWPPGY